MFLGLDLIHDKLIINRSTRKCFVFDLDGTIIFNGKRLSEKNEALLKQIVDNGHEVIFATGRSGFDANFVLPTWCHNFAKTLFNGGLSITSEGFVVRDVHLSKSSVVDISEMCLAKSYPFTVDGASHFFSYPLEHDIFKKSVDFFMARNYEHDLERLLLSNIYKILILHMDSYHEFNDYAVNNNLVIKHHSYDECFDLVPECCNKYIGIKSLVSNYDPSDVFVFGNDFNDYEMLSSFHNSVVFGNIEKLQNVAKINILYDNNLEIVKGYK